MQKIKEGALFAIGFTVVAFTIGYIYSFVAIKFIDSSDEYFGQSTEDIAIIESRIVRREERLVVLGKYVNNGDKAWNNLTIKADFFGNSGEFVDQCREYSGGPLRAGEEMQFKLECSSCADLTLDDVATHKVFVASGY